jgi:hypothetical protein
LKNKPEGLEENQRKLIIRMFNKKDNKVKKSASKTDKRSKKDKQMDQQPQSSNDCEEESTQEELDYLETQARRR